MSNKTYAREWAKTNLFNQNGVTEQSVIGLSKPAREWLEDKGVLDVWKSGRKMYIEAKSFDGKIFDPEFRDAAKAYKPRRGSVLRSLIDGVEPPTKKTRKKTKAKAELRDALKAKHAEVTQALSNNAEAVNEAERALSYVQAQTALKVLSHESVSLEEPPKTTGVRLNANPIAVDRS